jgi:hypothetical protein
MSDDPRFEVFTTPVGELVYPWLTKPDTRYDPDGVFQTKLLLPFELAQDFIAKLDGVLEDYIQTQDIKKQKSYNKADVYEDELDEDGNPTGNVLFKFKLKAKVVPREGDPWEQKVTCVHAADGSAVDMPIYGGTMARLRGQIVPYALASARQFGLTLRMKACQVHELVTAEGSGGGAFWTEFGEA